MTEVTLTKSDLDHAAERLARQMHSHFNEYEHLHPAVKSHAKGHTVAFDDLREAIKDGYRHVARRLIEAK